MRQDDLAPVLEEWGVGGMVWDGAPSPGPLWVGKQVTELDTTLVRLPAYAPELNPAERIFEEVRARVEGVVSDSLDAKQAEAERYLTQLKADPEAVKRLCGWSWLREALTSLPAAPA